MNLNEPTFQMLAGADAAGGPRLQRGRVCELRDDGSVQVAAGGQDPAWCECLASVGALAVGDRVLVLAPEDGEPGLVLGRIGRALPADCTLQAAQSLTLRCGESSLTLQADGKVLLKGDDVVVRAKGTQRIRAGHVAIN